MGEKPLNEYIDMEAYDVVSGEKYRALVEQLEALRDLSELTVHALLPIVPLRGSWNRGYQVERSISPTLRATVEEWAEAAGAVAALQDAIRGDSSPANSPKEGT